eukprot:Gb_34202 [translate_table: standard]
MAFKSRRFGIPSTTMQIFIFLAFLLVWGSQCIRDERTKLWFKERKRYEFDEKTLQIKRNSFASITRRELMSCPDFNPYLKLSVDPPGPLEDVQDLNITISGVHTPLASDWIAIVSPSSVKWVNLFF